MWHVDSSGWELFGERWEVPTPAGVFEGPRFPWELRVQWEQRHAMLSPKCYLSLQALGLSEWAHCNDPGDLQVLPALCLVSGCAKGLGSNAGCSLGPDQYRIPSETLTLSVPWG